MWKQILGKIFVFLWSTLCSYVVSLKVRETIFILKSRCKILYDKVCRQGECLMHHSLHVIKSVLVCYVLVKKRGVDGHEFTVT